MENSDLLLLTPITNPKDKKAETLRLLLSHKSRLDKNLIIGCLSYRLNKPKNKDKDHKMIVNKLVDVYNDHVTLVSRIEKFVPIYQHLPEGSIQLMSKIPYNTDIVLLHDMLSKKSLPNMSFRLRKAGREIYLDIKKPVQQQPTRTNSFSSYQEPTYQEPGYLDIMSFSNDS